MNTGSTVSNDFLRKAEKRLLDLGSHPEITRDERAIIDEFASLDLGAEPCALEIDNRRNDSTLKSP